MDGICIPVIDLGYLLQANHADNDSGDDNGDDRKTTTTTTTSRMMDCHDDEIVKLADELCTAFRSIGFATLIHHGIDSALLSNAFLASKRFFALPVEMKELLNYKNHEANRGYIGYGCESFAQEARNKTTTTMTTMAGPDKKETFDIGKDDEVGYSNEWPSEDQVPGFVSIMLQYFQEMDVLQKKILQLIGIGLNLKDPNYLLNSCLEQHENLRLLHYPELQIEITLSTTTSTTLQRGAIHTDFGTITLLTQDHIGGLRAQHIDGTWIDVPPVPDSIVINVGDMLQRWTNDVLRATPHQVIANIIMPSTPTPMTTSGAKDKDDDDDNDKDDDDENTGTVLVTIPERYSIAFFCNADKHIMLECLDECLSKDNQSKPNYDPINAHEYITKRLSETIHANANASTHTDN